MGVVRRRWVESEEGRWSQKKVGGVRGKWVESGKRGRDIEVECGIEHQWLLSWNKHLPQLIT